MEPIQIGLVVTGLLFIVVLLGMRVAFAAALAGLLGLVWIFWAKKGYRFDQLDWAITVAVKTAGQVPHSKISSQELSLIPTFVLIGYLAYYAGLTKALFEAAKRWLGWLPGGLANSSVVCWSGSITHRPANTSGLPPGRYADQKWPSSGWCPWH